MRLSMDIGDSRGSHGLAPPLWYDIISTSRNIRTDLPGSRSADPSLDNNRRTIPKHDADYMSITRYTQRLLNPYRGVISCIRHESAEAVTRDGVRWDIYVSNDRLLAGMDTTQRVQTSDIRYGSWSAQTGLKRGPLVPSDDFKYLEHMGAIVYEHLLEVHDRIPFPLADRFELWLLDPQARPLALLDSAVRPEDMELNQAAEWRAGEDCRKTFTSAVAGGLLPESDDEGALAGYLARHVNAGAGSSPAAQWIERRPDGSGAGLAGINLAPGLIGRELDGSEFPSLPLVARTADAVHRQLYSDFQRWQAPWLLSLPGLEREVRARLEREAAARPLLVARQYRLYPEIIDATAIRAARVEAMLCQSTPQDREGDGVLSIDYIELHPSPTE
jgi:hypothetical protein